MPERRPKISTLVKIVLVWTAVALIFTTLSFFGAIADGRRPPLAIVAAENLIRYYLWGALSPLVFLAARRFDFGRSGFAAAARDLALHLACAAALSAVHSAFYAVLMWSIFPAFAERYPNPWQYLQISFLGSVYLGLMVYAIVAFASAAYLRSRKHAEEERRSAQLARQLVEAQLQALKMQLQPHFLFNTLNSISALVPARPAEAQEMIARLGDFLRLTLDFNRSQMVPLDEELRFLRAYLDIERTRFGDRLRVEFRVEDEVRSAFVPHLALQPIVENSVKHGTARVAGESTIEIAARRDGRFLRLEVRDNGPGGELAADPSKTGIANVRARLAHLYGGDFTFAADGAAGGMKISIGLPLRHEFQDAEAADER